MLIQATQAYWKGKEDEASAERIAVGRGEHKRTETVKWAEAFTDYETA